MDKVEVTAHFDIQGKITPLNLIWNGSTYRVEDTGRRWEAKDGKHILVIITGNHVFHLMFNTDVCTLYLLHSNMQPQENQF